MDEGVQHPSAVCAPCGVNAGRRAPHTRTQHARRRTNHDTHNHTHTTPRTHNHDTHHHGTHTPHAHTQTHTTHTHTPPHAHPNCDARIMRAGHGWRQSRSHVKRNQQRRHRGMRVCVCARAAAGGGLINCSVVERAPSHCITVFRSAGRLRGVGRAPASQFAPEAIYATPLLQQLARTRARVRATIYLLRLVNHAITHLHGDAPINPRERPAVPAAPLPQQAADGAAEVGAELCHDELDACSQSGAQRKTNPHTHTTTKQTKNRHTGLLLLPLIDSTRSAKDERRNTETPLRIQPSFSDSNSSHYCRKAKAPTGTLRGAPDPAPPPPALKTKHQPVVSPKKTREATHTEIKILIQQQQANNRSQHKNKPHTAANHTRLRGIGWSLHALLRCCCCCCLLSRSRPSKGRRRWIRGGLQTRRRKRSSSG